MHERAEARQQPGEQAHRQTPHHQRPGRRRGEQIRRNRRQRQRPEHDDRHRGDPDLGGDGEPERLGQPARARQQPGDRPGQGHQTGGGADRQPPTDRADEEGVGEDADRHGEAEEPHAGHGTIKVGGRRRQRGHRGRPQHRRFEAREHREPGDDGERRQPSASQRESTQQRCQADEDEGHVLARYRREVGEPAGAKGVDDGRRLVTVVADHETEVERPLGRRQHRGAPLQRAPDAVGRLGQDVSGSPVGDDLNVDAGGDVPRPQGGGARAADRGQPAVDDHDVAGEAATERAAGAPEGEELDVAPPEPGDRGPPGADRRRVGEQHDRRASQPCRIRPRQTPLGGGGQCAGEHERGKTNERRATRPPGGDADHGHRTGERPPERPGERPGETDGNERADRGRGGEGGCPGVPTTAAVGCAPAMEPRVASPVPDGPAAYRQRVRRRGALLGLLVPAITLAAALVLYRASPCTGTGCVRGRLGSWVLAALALPTALPFGIPLKSDSWRWMATAVSSALLWFTLGTVAARRVSRRAVVTWRNWWAEFVWYLLAVWVGELVGLRLLASALTRRGIV